jgi:phosphoglucosamine mutase
MFFYDDDNMTVPGMTVPSLENEKAQAATHAERVLAAKIRKGETLAVDQCPFNAVVDQAKANPAEGEAQLVSDQTDPYRSKDSAGLSLGSRMTRKFFGTDGIRGSANSYPMTSEVALKVGMAAGKVFTNGSYRHRVVIGKDTRLSGYMIESSLVSGFTAVGMDVFQLGPMPTPAVAMLTRSLRADLGVMISASHNPFMDNGIKLFGPDGYKLSDEKEAEIEKLMQGDTATLLAPPDKIGQATRIDSARERYIEFVKRTLPRDLHFGGIRAVIDCANGAAYKVAPEALWELGAEVIKIGVDPNGLNINKDCGSTAPQDLIHKVNEVRADIGIGFDGDADRVVMVDEKGHIIDGDQLMAVIAEFWLRRGRLAGGGIVATVMSNLGLERYLEDLGLSLARTPVGDRYVVEHMRQYGYNVGGEQSGHIVLSDFSTTGDGLVTALQVLAVVAQSGKPVSEICNRFEPLPQILENVCYKSGQPLDNVGVQRAISDGQSKLGKAGRLVIRPSGTEPVIRVMAEGDDEGLVKTVVSDIVHALTGVAA